MQNFIIAYEPNDLGTNNDRFANKMSDLGGFQCHQSTWLLKSQLTSIVLRDELSQLIMTGDRLMVVEVSRWASSNLQAAAEYLNYRAPPVQPSMSVPATGSSNSKPPAASVSATA